MMPITASSQRRYIRSDWKQWLEGMRQLRKVRRKLAKEYSPHGEKWTHNMLAHWDRRLADLEKREPPKYVE